MDAVDQILAQWRRERPDLNVTPMGLLGRMARLQVHLRREIEGNLAQHGLSAPNFDILATLRRAGPPFALSPGELLATAMITSGTMTTRVDQLAKLGLVSRQPNPDDGRSVIVTLTPAGRELVDAAVTSHVATQAAITAPLSAEDFDLLDDLLGRYLAYFEPPK